MSDDNFYEFNENEASTFDIPEDNAEPTDNTKDEVNNSTSNQQQQEEEEEEEDDDEGYDPSSSADTPVPTDPRKKNEQQDEPEEKTNEDEGEHLYDSVDEDEEEKKIESQSISQSSNESEVATKPNDQSESVNEESTENKEEPTTQESIEQPQGEEKEEEEEEDDDYDPTADLSSRDEHGSSTVSTSISASVNAPIPQLSSAPAVASNSISATPNTQAAALANSLPTGSNSNGLKQSVDKIMSSNLLSDPEFLKLPPAEQQKKILSLLQTDSQPTATATTPSAHPSISQFNQSIPRNHRPDLRNSMTLDEVAKYNTFVDNEAKYASGRHTPAPNSRLFVGNLPSNSITKQDLFRLFQGYGHILQIALKGSYAFIQFSDSEAVENAIRTERGVPLNGKDLVLEIAKNSRPGQTTNDRLYNNSQSGNVKRGRDDYDGSDKRRRRNGLIECQIFVKRTADPGYAKDVAREFQDSNIATEYEFLRPGQDLSKKINDIAYAGVLAVVLINKNKNCDVQIYEKTPEGSVRYDEYLSINSNDATKLLLRAKEKQYSSRSGGYGGGSSSYGSGANSYGGSRDSYSSQSQQSSFNQGNSFYQQAPQPQAPLPAQNILQALQGLPPSALQNLMAMAQGQAGMPQQQQPFQQSYPQQFQQPQQPSYGAPQVDLASLLGKVQAQAQPQQQFSNQGYNPIGGNSYQQYQQPQHQQPQHQQPPQQQQQQNQPQGGNVQSLLDSLAKLQK